MLSQLDQLLIRCTAFHYIQCTRKPPKPMFSNTWTSLRLTVVTLTRRTSLKKNVTNLPKLSPPIPIPDLTLVTKAFVLDTYTEDEHPMPFQHRNSQTHPSQEESPTELEALAEQYRRHALALSTQVDPLRFHTDCPLHIKPFQCDRQHMLLIPVKVLFP